jgi:hypothetical protein
MRTPNLGVTPGVDLHELTSATAQVDAMRASIEGMKSALSDFGQSSYRLADTINRHLKSIGEQATATANSLNSLSGAAAGAGATTPGASSGGTSTSSGFINKANTAASWVNTASQNINNVQHQP